MSDEIEFGKPGDCPYPFTVEGYVVGKSGNMKVTIQADRGDNLFAVLKWMVDNSIVPQPAAPVAVAPGTAGPEVVKPPKPGRCPSCGAEKWNWDKGDKGWYCGNKPDGVNWCGFKSWRA